MNSMKTYPDINQCKKLAEILPLKSADMGLYYSCNTLAASNQMWVGTKPENADIPCWSLAALLDIIPYPTLGKHADETWSCASWIEKVNPYFVEGCDSPINACYEMILKLHELNLL